MVSHINPFFLIFLAKFYKGPIWLNFLVCILFIYFFIHFNFSHLSLNSYAEVIISKNDGLKLTKRNLLMKEKITIIPWSEISDVELFKSMNGRGVILKMKDGKKTNVRLEAYSLATKYSPAGFYNELNYSNEEEKKIVDSTYPSDDCFSVQVLKIMNDFRRV